MREEFPTGSLRDTSEGKPRYDLVSLKGLTRLAHLMARGAKKYGERNWEKGQPVSRFYQSALRHLYQWASGDTSEDHLAAVAYNVFGIIEMQERVAEGVLPEELDDMFNTSALMYTLRNRITYILVEQLIASCTQNGVSKYLSIDGIVDTLAMDAKVDKGMVSSIVDSLVMCGDVEKSREGYAWK